MAVRTIAEVTVTDETDIDHLVTWYLRSTSPTKPSAPQDGSAPPSPWTSSEPGYDSSLGTTYLYTVTQTVWGDGSLTYGEVQLSSAYEAAKAAYNEASSVRTYATTEFQRTDAAIALRATKEEVDEVAGRIVGRNLFRGTKDAGEDNWNFYGHESVPESGILRLTPTTAVAYAKYKVNYLDFTEYGSGTFTVSLDVRRLAGEYTDKKLRVILGFNRATRLNYVLSSTHDRFGNAYIAADEIGTDWTRVSATFDVPEDLNTGRAETLEAGSQLTFEPFLEASGNPVEIRRVKLERGDVATEWSEAPEDYTDEQVSIARAEIKVTTDGITSEVEKKTDKATIISTINQSAETVKIEASKVEITGDAVFSAINNDTGTTKISGGKIDATSITIGGANLATQSDVATVQDDLDKSKDWYGTCSTAAGTAAKVVVCDGFTVGEGVRLTVRCSTASSANVTTLTVQDSDGNELMPATTVHYNAGAASSSNPIRYGVNAVLHFVYDGTVWLLDEKPPSYSTTCSTAAGTRDKAASAGGVLLVNGTRVTIRFSTANTYKTNSVRLNLASTGAIGIYSDNVATSASHNFFWDANTVLTFTQQGTIWHLADNGTRTMSENAAKTATNYITADTDGIKIHMQDNSTTYQHQTASGTTFYVNGKKRSTVGADGLRVYVESTETEVASFTADGAQIGASDSTHTVIDAVGLIAYAADGTTLFEAASSGTTEETSASILYANKGIDEVSFSVTLANGSSYTTTLPQLTLDTGDSNPRYKLEWSFNSSNWINSSISASLDVSSYMGYGIRYSYTSSTRQLKITNESSASAVLVKFVNKLYIVTRTSSAPYFTFGTRKEDSVIGGYSSSLGINVTASGQYSHAEGQVSKAIGNSAHAEGSRTTASSSCSHAEGSNTTASSNDSHAEGSWTTASGVISHAEGYYAKASGAHSHSEGYYSEANGAHSHAQNKHTIAGYDDQTAIGAYNDNQSTNAFEIGNGTADDARSNAFTVDWSGNVMAAGTVSAAVQTGTMTLDSTHCTLVTNYAYARHNGICATVQLGAFQLKSALGDANTITVGTVPDGFRPPARTYATVAIANAAVGGAVSAYINADGTIGLVNRSGATLGTPVVFTITATYII